MSAMTMTHAIKARMIAKTLGMRTAAGFLRNRGYSLEVAIELLGLPKRG
jgi:thermostable 8-oxoguanine DNA glycosylase